MIRPALSLYLLLTVATGLAYPALVTGIAQVAMPWRANGSPIERDGRVVGSALVGQAFDDPRYFWSRPSATGANAAASSGANVGPTHPALVEAISARIAALRASDPGNTAPIPIDLVTSSASGIDPHLSPEAARWQVARVARVRGLPEAEVRALVESHVEGPTLGVLGEPRVNVLALDLALDALRP